MTTTMDACLIAAGQRAEHYEMAAYGTLVAWAQAMGHTEAAKLLQQTLDEEKAADKKLSGLAEGGINQSAADAAGGEEDNEEEEEDEEEQPMSASPSGGRKGFSAKGSSSARTGELMSKPFAIVTGASSGIGLELAAICAQEGFDLLVAADRPEIQTAADRFRSLGADSHRRRNRPGDDRWAWIGSGPRRRAGRSTRCSPMRDTGWDTGFSIRTSRTHAT